MLKDRDIAVLKDVRNAFAASLRIIAKHNVLDEFMDEMERLKIKDGIEKITKNGYATFL